MPPFVTSRDSVRVQAAEKTLITVSVRELVEFTLRNGDLGGGGSFVGRHHALAGTRGHQRVQRSREEGYAKEVTQSIDVEHPLFTLRVQGRVDGIRSLPEGVVLEEIKTVHGAWERRADPLHWAQVKIYGYIYARRHGLDRVQLQLTYLELESGNLTELREEESFDDLTGLFDRAVGIYTRWVEDRLVSLRQRDESIAALDFPFPAYRAGQRELAVAVYRALSGERRLFLEAPTGIGKTMGVIFPALKCLPAGEIDRIFYLTARTVGRLVAEETVAALIQKGLRLRSLTLTAKEKICPVECRSADAAQCPFTRGYYDRIKGAMQEALGFPQLTRSVLEELGRKHEVCPFELSLDTSLWVDFIIGDYNYVFDPRVYLRRHFAEGNGRHLFLVDEAHNLVDRAREMFSADLQMKQIVAVRKHVRPSLPQCARALSRLEKSIRTLAIATPETGDHAEVSELEEPVDLFADQPEVAGSVQSIRRVPVPRRADGECCASREKPEGVEKPLEKALIEVEKFLARNQPAAFRESLLELYFRLLAFQRTLEGFDAHYVTLATGGSAGNLRLFCLDPSPGVGEALKRGRAVVFFSATLSPSDYYRTLLGGRPDDPWLRLPSPFDPDQLTVFIDDRVETRYRSRDASLSAVVQSIGAVIARRKGNYLVYFPSYAYLTKVYNAFVARYPTFETQIQHSGMEERERERFLAAFRSDGDRALVGFAVMGGIFGEGIDLVGERLTGVVVVGVGLPQLCLERDLIRDYFQEQNQRGFEYAYMFPGMNRVLQATGRVIRSETDRGVVLLIDSRFRQLRYQRLFPDWWNAQTLSSAVEMARLRESDG